MVKVEPIRVCQKQENLNATLTLFYNQVGFFYLCLEQVHHNLFFHFERQV